MITDYGQWLHIRQQLHFRWRQDDGQHIRHTTTQTHTHIHTSPIHRSKIERNNIPTTTTDYIDQAPSRMVSINSADTFPHPYSVECGIGVPPVGHLLEAPPSKSMLLPNTVRMNLVKWSTDTDTWGDGCLLNVLAVDAIAEGRECGRMRLDALTICMGFQLAIEISGLER